MFSLLSAVVVSAFCVVFFWHWYHFSYWKRHGVQHIRGTALVGNVKNLLLYRCCFGDQFKQLYNHKDAQRAAVVGIHVLHNRALLLRDPELIKRILVRDFSAFASRFETTDPVGDAMGSLNLFFAKYDVWKEIHNIFTPLFAHGKIKQMYPLLQQIGVKLEEHLIKLHSTSNARTSESLITEVKELSALFTTDVIASIAFGVQANSLEDPCAEFRQMCIEVNTPRPKRILHLFTMFFFPQLVERLGTHLYSHEYEHFMRNSLSYVIAERERSGLKRGDLIDIFITLKEQQLNATESVVNKPDFFAAQAAFLLLAGFDTSSSTISFALYELAKAQGIQARLRLELKAALERECGVMSYETVNALPYLRMVVDEVLRLYPPTAFLDRCCTADAGYSLQPYSAFTVPKGMPVYISVLGLHRDEKLWPEANVFNPDRFSTENRKLHTPMSYLPFGSGPRGCIGSLLGLLEVKVGLIYILKNYIVKPCEKTPREMSFDPKTFVLTADGGNYLQFTKSALF